MDWPIGGVQRRRNIGHDTTLSMGRLDTAAQSGSLGRPCFIEWAWWRAKGDSGGRRGGVAQAQPVQVSSMELELIATSDVLVGTHREDCSSHSHLLLQHFHPIF